MGGKFPCHLPRYRPWYCRDPACRFPLASVFACLCIFKLRGQHSLLASHTRIQSSHITYPHTILFHYTQRHNENRRHGPRGQVPRRRPNTPEMARSRQSKARTTAADTTSSNQCANTKTSHPHSSQRTLLSRFRTLGSSSSACGTTSILKTNIRPRHSARDFYNPSFPPNTRKRTERRRACRSPFQRRERHGS